MPASIIVAGNSGTEQQRLSMTTEAWLSKVLSDHTTNKAPLLKWLKENRRVKRGGVGLNMSVPLMYFMADNVRMTGVTDPLVSRARKIPKGSTRAKFNCAEVMQTFSIPNRERKTQGDQTTVLNAIDAHTALAEAQWRADLIAMIWAAETATTSAGDESNVASIRTLVNKGTSAAANTFYGPLPRPAQSTRDDGNGWATDVHGQYPAGGASAVTLVGGISRITVDTGIQFCCPVWRPDTTGATFGRLPFNQMLSAGGLDDEKIDLMFLDPDLYDGLVGILQAQQQLQPSRMANYGFEAIRWRDCEFMPEDNMPTGSVSLTGQALGICSKNLAWVSVDEKPEVYSVDAADANVMDYRVTDYCQLVPKKLGRGLGVRHCAILKPTS